MNKICIVPHGKLAEFRDQMESANNQLKRVFDAPDYPSSYRIEVAPANDPCDHDFKLLAVVLGESRAHFRCNNCGHVIKITQAQLLIAAQGQKLPNTVPACGGVK